MASEPPADLPTDVPATEVEKSDRDGERSSSRHRHSSSRHRSRSRSRDRHHRRSHRSRSRSRSRDRYRPYSHSSSRHSYSSRSYSREEHDRARSSGGDRDRRGRSRSRERRGGNYDRDRSAERAERREREENDKLYGVLESERQLRTLFVGNMPLKAAEKDIAEFFGGLGCKVREVQLVRDKNKKSKGLGYIEFYEKDSCERASTFNQIEFWGKRIEVSGSGIDAEKGVQITMASSLGPKKLLVNQLHYAITQDMIREIYSIYGEVERIDIELDEVGVSKGIATVQFKTAEACKIAVEETNGIEVASRPIRVSYVNEQRAENPMMMVSSMQMQTTQLPYESERLEEEGHLKTAQQRAMLMARLQSAESSHNIAGLTGMGASASVVLPQPQTTGHVSMIGGYVPQSASGVLGVPSPCLVLKNMFNPAEETSPDFDVEIGQDVSEECAQFGRVLHVHVEKNSLGFVYLRFENAQAAAQAAQALHGRWFAGRQVSAEFIAPVMYEAQFPAAKI